jgi:hypothetical protein
MQATRIQHIREWKGHDFGRVQTDLERPGTGMGQHQHRRGSREQVQGRLARGLHGERGHPLSGAFNEPNEASSTESIDGSSNQGKGQAGPLAIGNGSAIIRK